jgi:hypothetical protein
MMIGPSGFFTITSSPPICYIRVSLLGVVGLQNKVYKLKLGCEKLFLEGHILSTIGDALSRV